MTEAPEEARPAEDTEKPCPKWVDCRYVRFAIIALMVAAVAFAAFVAWWALTPLGPSAEATAALQDSSWVDVTETSYGWRFQPANTAPPTGVILYPGGHVDARSYAPLAHAIASRGHAVSIVEFPLALAVLSPNAADLPVEQETYVETWVLAGHSLGGVMGARYAQAHPDTIAGLVLLASYPDEKADLSASDLAGASVVGTVDGVLDTAAWEAARGFLPPDTQIVEIAGGNHSQFGSYGLQNGDNPATISEADQREQIADVTVELLKQLSADTLP